MNVSRGLAVVTGGSRGIGRAIVKRLCADGYSVLFTYVASADKAQELVDSVKAVGGRARAIRCDNGSLDDIRALFQSVDGQSEPLRVLVNNAALFALDNVESANDELFTQIVHANMRAPLFLAQESAKRLKQGGRLIFITSVAAREASPAYISYSMSKAAVHALVRGLAVALGPAGITVNAVAPGMTATDMTRILTAAAPPELTDMVAQATALKRIGQPEDIANAVAMIASDDGRWVTGQVIDCSGGHAL